MRTRCREKCPRNRSEKGAFPGVAWPPDAKPPPFRRRRNTVDQNRANLAQGGRLVYKASWNRRVKGNSGLTLLKAREVNK
jgi:hypothetical protein